MSKERFICSYVWPIGESSRDHKTFYVESLPGRKGNVRFDWGWTDDPKKALPISHYWMRRFVSFCHNRYSHICTPVRIPEAK